MNDELSSDRIERQLTTLFPSTALEDHAEAVGVVKRDSKFQIPAMVWALVFGFAVGESRTLAAFRRAYNATADKMLSPGGFYQRLTPLFAAYLRDLVEFALDSSRSLAANIQSQILSEHGVLHNEPEFLLRTEFGIREPQTYYTILRAIATGKRAANEIAGFAGVDSNALGSYLSKLRRLRLVERDIPVTADPNSTRKSRYRLKEPLFRFWFRYVYGQQGQLVQLSDDAYDQLVEPTFTDYMGTMFERVCQNVLPSLIPKTYQGVGYWWHKQHELDVVGLGSDGTLVAGECKYTSRKMTEGDLADLERAASAVQWTPPNESDRTEQYCCFCRSGFSDGLQQVAAERDDVSLFTPTDIVPGDSA